MDDETAFTRESNEVNNGRLAMLAFWELVRHDLVKEPGEHLITGLPFLYNSKGRRKPLGVEVLFNENLPQNS